MGSDPVGFGGMIYIYIIYKSDNNIHSVEIAWAVTQLALEG